MKKFKKLAMLVLAGTLAVSMLAGCGSRKNQEATVEKKSLY